MPAERKLSAAGASQYPSAPPGIWPAPLPASHQAASAQRTGWRPPLCASECGWRSPWHPHALSWQTSPAPAAAWGPGATVHQAPWKLEAEATAFCGLGLV